MGSLLLFNQIEFLSQTENKCFMIFFPILLILLFRWVLFKSQAQEIQGFEETVSTSKL